MMGIMASNDDKLEGSAGMGKIGRSYPRFDETLVLMKQHLGIEHVAQPRANAGRIRVDVDRLPARTRDALARYVRLDDELYRLAQDLFEAHVERAGPAFHRDLERLRIEMGPCPSAPPMATPD